MHPQYARKHNWTCVPMEVFAVPVLLPFVRVERLLVLALEVALVAPELVAGLVRPHVRDQLRPASALEFAAFLARH